MPFVYRDTGHAFTYASMRASAHTQNEEKAKVEKPWFCLSEPCHQSLTLANVLMTDCINTVYLRGSQDKLILLSYWPGRSSFPETWIDNAQLQSEEATARPPHTHSSTFSLTPPLPHSPLTRSPLPRTLAYSDSPTPLTDSASA